MGLPRTVKLVEVGARDGLQSEPTILSVKTRIALLKKLTVAGFSHIEAGSFVSPKAIPQMVQSDEVLQGLDLAHPHTHYSVLVPNLHGLKAAIKSQCKEIAIFASASHTFSQKNINCDIETSLLRYKEVIQEAQRHKMAVRGYLSCVFGCPYEGQIPLSTVVKLAKRLHQLGCYEISFGDTVGLGNIKQTEKLIASLGKHLPKKAIAMHFHDTRAQALPNIYAALNMGIRTFDCAVGGVGGCPYAKSASGNVASEDLLHMLNGLGIKTGINLQELIKANHFLSKQLKRPLNAKLSLIKHPRQELL